MKDMQIRRSGGNPYKSPDVRLGRSQFNMSHGHKTTFDVGAVVPFYLQEVLPGDSLTLKMNAFCRIFSPLEAPIMDNISLEIDFFYVPNRLVWDNWAAFLGEHDAAGAQDTDYTVPIHLQSTTAGVTQGQVGHYLGIPSQLDFQDVEVSALPARGYWLIINEYYRDQNLEDRYYDGRTGDGPDSRDVVNAAPYTSAKRHDYFTSALPYLQKGTAQTIPFDNAPIIGIAATDQSPSVAGSGTYYETGGSTPAYTQAYANNEMVFEATAPSGALPAIYADLSSVSVSINALREATAIQRLLERDARGGTRHVEIIKAHFGVDVPDYRVARPEYLGGGQGLINVSPVANTSSTAGENQGELRGIGTGSLRAGIGKSFVEHGYVFGLIRARGDITYHQGLDRHWSRSSKYDFFWPELSNLGEQPILNKELFVSNATATDDAVFGYQERYAEYRYKPSKVSGKFDPNVSGALSFWHLAEDFSTLPTLNTTFIHDATPMSRVQTVTTEPDFVIDAWFDQKMARPIPVRPNPSLMPARY